MLNHYYTRLVHDDLPKRYMQSRAMHIMVSFFLFFYALKLFLIFPTDWTQVSMAGIPALVIILVSLFSKNKVEQKDNNRVFRILEIGLLGMGSEFFFSNHESIIGLLFALIALFILAIFWMESRLFEKQFVDFKENEIIFPTTFFDKKILWHNVQAVLIKNDYLTLQLKNNKYLQHKIFDSFTAEEREDFQLFCETKTKA